MRVFKTKIFARFARKEGVLDATVVEIAKALESGRVDAGLGGGVIKQRLARTGKGKSGGYRVIIFFSKGDRSVFFGGYAKSDLDNISDTDLKSFKKLAAEYLAYGDGEVAKLLLRRAWIEVEQDD